MEGLELACFSIISNVGAAKSMYIQALSLAKEGKYDEAKDMIVEGEAMYVEGHKAHMELVQQEAGGEKVETSLILMHAEDQLISTEVIKMMVLEFIELYQKVQ